MAIAIDHSHPSIMFATSGFGQVSLWTSLKGKEELNRKETSNAGQVDIESTKGVLESAVRKRSRLSRDRQHSF